jgi:hypothetical protein
MDTFSINRSGDRKGERAFSVWDSRHWRVDTFNVRLCAWDQAGFGVGGIVGRQRLEDTASR